jgi:SAM-dependent methyltransferase
MLSKSLSGNIALIAVVCDLTLMLMPRPADAVSEVRRVLRPGGRFSLSVWADRDRNPWRLILEEVLGRPPSSCAAEARGPGLFALGDVKRVRDLLSGAGFTAIEVQSISAPHVCKSAAEWWKTELGLSSGRKADFERFSPGSRERAKAQALERVGRYRQPDGGLALPAEVLVTVGTRP